MCSVIDKNFYLTLCSWNAKFSSKSPLSLHLIMARVTGSEKLVFKPRYRIKQIIHSPQVPLYSTEKLNKAKVMKVLLMVESQLL